MIAYLDTSAIVPILIQEPSSDICRMLWDSADDIATSQLAYVETAAALAAAHRLQRLSTAAHRDALKALDQLWADLDALPVNEELLVTAADLAAVHALRGYDALHCATALRIADPQLVAAAGDRQLLQTWSDLGVATLDVNLTQPPTLAE